MKRRIFIVAMAIALAVIGLLVPSHDSTPMPVYEARTARQWLYGAGDSDPFAVAAAFREMGSNAVPFLMHELERKDSPFAKSYSRVYSKLPSFVRRHISEPYTDLQRWNDASTALSMAQSRTAIPPLMRLLTNSEAFQPMSVLIALDKLVGPADTNCVTTLMSCSRSKEFYVVVEAADVLSRISPGKVEIPPITNLLASTNRWAQDKCLDILIRVDSNNATIWNDLSTNRSAWVEWQRKMRGNQPSTNLPSDPSNQ